MGKRKDNKKLLLEQAEKDNATIISINNININNIESPTQSMFVKFICGCGIEYIKNTRIILVKSGLFCNLCTKKNKENKRKNTCLKIFGVENILQTQIFKDKKIDTCLEKYGVENPFQSQIVKNKKIDTCLKNFGVENPSQSQIIKNKKIETSLRNFGVEHPSKSEIVRNKCKKTCIERYGTESASCLEIVQNKMKTTNLKRYGVEHISHSQIVKNKSKETSLKQKTTNLKKFGVEYPMQVKEIFEKQQKNAFKTKTYKFNTGENIEVQGYENIALKELEEKYNYTYQDYIKWNDLKFWYNMDKKNHKYYPDIPFIKENKIIEVKSDYTFNKLLYQNLKKAYSVMKQNIDFEFWIYNNKKQKILVLTNKKIKLFYLRYICNLYIKGQEYIL